MGQPASLNMGQDAGLNMGQAVGNTESLNAVLNTELAKTLWPLRQDTTKAFLCQSQVGLCEVLAMWPKLTADWMVSLSVITRLQAIVYCEVFWLVDNIKVTFHHWEWKKKTDVFITQLEHHRMLWDWSEKTKVTKDHLCPAVLCQVSEATFKTTLKNDMHGLVHLIVTSNLIHVCVVKSFSNSTEQEKYTNWKMQATSFNWLKKNNVIKN